MPIPFTLEQLQKFDEVSRRTITESIQPLDDEDFSSALIGVSASEVAKFLLFREVPADKAVPVQTTTSAPVGAVGASGGVGPDKAGPPSLTTGDIAFCFAGLRWKTEQEWKDVLGKNRGWLDDCLVRAGTRGRGGVAKLWNPVLIGAALVHQGYVEQHSVRAKFQTATLLKPWLDAWETHKADYIDTE